MLKRSLASLALLCASLAHADCGELNVAYYDHGAFYSRHSDGSWGGIDKDVIDELARRCGCRFTASIDSRVRIWTRLANGTLDMTVSGIPLPEREKFARFIPYIYSHNYALLAKSVAPELRTPEAFLAETKYKVGAVRSFKHGVLFDAWLDKLRAQGRVYEASDFSTLVHLFKIGRVQAIVAQPMTWVTRLQPEEFTAMDWAPNERVVGALVLSRARVPQATYESMEKAIRAMREDGTLRAIFERHVGPELAVALLN
ncbi:MAG: transporter substrate-binding domain-containing protein [Pseudomonadota bacterium]